MPYSCRVPSPRNSVWAAPTVITVGAAQTLFLGEGTRQEYGMIRFDGEPFDVSESYMRLMLEG